MSLPNGFENCAEYFHKVNEFLKQNSWIYREANTEFVRAGILNEMPPEFQDYFGNVEVDELNKFSYVHEPLLNLSVKALMEFRQNLAKLIPPEAFEEPKAVATTIKMENPKKINLKKQHEIQRLAAKVKEILKIKENLNEGENENEEEKEKEKEEEQSKFVLIDVGAGLGYLSELLYKLNKNLLILGLEADPQRVAAAQKRIETYLPTAIDSIQYRQQFVTENSKEFIVQTAKKVFKLNYQHIPEQQTTTKMVIIGLHACADLTITSMKLFLQLPQIQHLIIMPCCYHKMQVCDNAAAATAKNFLFRNFPTSESLKQVLLGNNKDNHNQYDRDSDSNYGVTNETCEHLNRPFLRLACQQTLKRWSKCSALQHQAHGNEMFFRAVAESLKREEEKENEEMELVIIKCKTTKIDLSCLSAEQLESFEIFSLLYILKNKTTNQILDWSEKHRKKFSEIIEKYPKGGKLSEGLTCLQTSMQKLCENLVLYDRLCFMEETALKMNLKISVRYEKIMDEELSPRCYVLIAEKL